MVENIKTNHNYQLHIESRLEGDEFEEDAVNYNRFYINDRAWYYDDSDLNVNRGIIYQKDQGYVQFYQSGSNIVPMDLKSDEEHDFDPSIFDCTTPEKTISEIYSVIGENLFHGSYNQDSSNRAKFTTTSQENRAVAANMTQYAGYIPMGQFAVDNEMVAVIDVENEEIKLSLNYWLHYFDETEKTAEGNIKITLKNIGEVSNTAVESYIESPTTVFAKPTEWPEGSDTLFSLYYNGVTPVLPNSLSFAATFDRILYDGFFYAGWVDYACGDITNSYKVQLLADGYEQVGGTTSKFVKKVEAEEGKQVNYRVTLVHKPGDEYNPNGRMFVLYRANLEEASFENIEKYNAYMTSNNYDELVPLFPSEATCTGITNFKDRSLAYSDSYAMYINSTDTFKVSIPSYTKAQQWFESYKTLMFAKGYTNVQSFLSMKNYGFEDSSSGTYIGVDFPDEINYKGQIGFRFVVTQADADELRTRGAILSDIEISGYTTSYSQGDTFRFDGICKAVYENGAKKNVTPTFVSTPDMSQVGTQEVTVSYTEGEITKSKEYTISIVQSKTLVDISLSGTYQVKFRVGSTFNHSGLAVKATFSDKSVDYVGNSCQYSTPNMSQLGYQNVIVSYTFKGVTKSATYQIYIAETLTFPSLTYTGDNVEGWFMDDYYDDISTWNFNNSRSFLFGFVTLNGATFKSISVAGDEGAIITLNDEYDGYYEYVVQPSLNLEASEIVINVVTEGGITPSTKYNVTVADTDHGSVCPEEEEYEEGEIVYFSAVPASGYEIDEMNVTGGLTITHKSGNTYSFEMPANDVEITVTFKEKEVPQKYALSKTSGMEEGRIVLKSPSIAGDVEVGTEVKFTVEAYEGYEIDEVFIKDHKGEVTINTRQEGVYPVITVYYFTMPAFDCEITATFKSATQKYALSKTSGMEEGRIVLKSPSVAGDVEVGTEVKFTVEAYEGYEIDEVFIKDHKGEVTINTRQEGVFPVITVYYFTMPAFDCEITATFNSVTPTLTEITLRGDYKTRFSVGETFSYEGLIVDAKYSDGSTVTNVSGFIVSSPDMSTEGTKTVTVTYKDDAETEVSTTYSITVGSAPEVNPEDALVAAGVIAGEAGTSGKAVSFEFKSDGTGIFISNTGAGANAGVWQFNWSMTLVEGTTYSILLSNMKCTGGSSAYTPKGNQIIKCEVTLSQDLTSVSSYDIVFKFGFPDAIEYPFVLD